MCHALKNGQLNHFWNSSYHRIIATKFCTAWTHQKGRLNDFTTQRHLQPLSNLGRENRPENRACFCSSCVFILCCALLRIMFNAEHNMLTCSPKRVSACPFSDGALNNTKYTAVLIFRAQTKSSQQSHSVVYPFSFNVCVYPSSTE